MKVVCRLITDDFTPVGEVQVVECSICHRELWLSESTVNDAKGVDSVVVPLCFPCYFPILIARGEEAVGPSFPGKHSVEFLKAHGIGQKDIENLIENIKEDAEAHR